MKHNRERYQHGSLKTEKRKTGPDVHVLRWREMGADGKMVRRKQIIGSVLEYPSKASVRRAADSIRIQFNNGPSAGAGMTVADVTEHYKQTELSNGETRTARTRAVYAQHLEQCILPKWGDKPITHVRAVDVEAWLKSLPGAPATKAKTKVVFSGVFQHAHRHGWVHSNPMRSVRQSMRPVKVEEVLTPEEVSSILAELPEPFRTIVHLAATTGMRRGEVFGLKWEDLDLEGSQVRIVRSIVDQECGEPKTPGSKRPLPLPAEVIEPLRAWKAKTAYAEPTDWVFASPYALGEFPYWPNSVLEKQIKPAALRAEIKIRLGWHTFRRTFATLLQRAVHDPKVTQDLMRHASPTLTLGRYAQSVTADKRAAQAKVSALITSSPQRTAA